MRLLLVEDKDSFRRLLVQALAESSWEVRATGDPQEALDWLGEEAFQVLVTDLRLPGLSGLELIRRGRRLRPDLRVVLMSAFGEPKDIVEAMRLGADDFLPKPFDLEVFLALIDRLTALVGAPPPDPQEPWVALSPAMRTLEEGLVRAADSDAAVIFVGGEGAGRGRCARRLHLLRHPRAPYRALVAASLAPEQVDPQALRSLQGGSVYVPGLDALPPSRLPDLLRALESPLGQGLHWMGGCRDLGALPESLRLRLGVLTFEVAPLSARKEDLLPLFRALLQAESRRQGRSAPVLDRPAEKQVLSRPWPGNVRELGWVVRRVLEEAPGPLIASLPEPSRPGGRGLLLPWPERGSLEAMVKALGREAEGALLRRALQEGDWDLCRVSEALGISLRTLGQRLREHGIPLEEA